MHVGSPSRRKVRHARLFIPAPHLVRDKGVARLNPSTQISISRFTIEIRHDLSRTPGLRCRTPSGHDPFNGAGRSVVPVYYAGWSAGGEAGRTANGCCRIQSYCPTGPTEAILGTFMVPASGALPDHQGGMP